MRLPWHASMALAFCASTFGVMPPASAEIAGPFAASVAFLAPARPDDIPLATVPLGFAANYSILSKAGISTTGTTAIVGPIGVSPIAGTAITGFSLTMHSSNRYSTSPRVVGGVYAASYAAPTPAWLTSAVGDMQTAYTNAAGRMNPNEINMGAGNIGGLIIGPGLYKWNTNVLVPADVVLWGNKNAVWIFQIAGTLNVASGKKILLTGGAQPRNVFWQVAGATTIGTTAVFAGTILGKTSIVFKTGATLNGRALAQTAVTLDANAIQRPPL